MYKIKGKNIVQINEKEIILPLTIHRSLKTQMPYILELNNFIIVNFFPCGEEDGLKIKENREIYSRNVWALSQKGELVWKIESLDVIPGKTGSYSDISLKDGELLAGNTLGITVSVNLENGKVTIVPNQGRPW